MCNLLIAMGGNEPEVQCLPPWHGITLNVNVPHLQGSPLRNNNFNKFFFLLFLPRFERFSDAADSFSPAFDLIAFVVAFVVPQFLPPCLCQLGFNQMWLWRINANVQLH